MAEGDLFVTRDSFDRLLIRFEADHIRVRTLEGSDGISRERLKHVETEVESIMTVNEETRKGQNELHKMVSLLSEREAVTQNTLKLLVGITSSVGLAVIGALIKYFVG